MLQSKIDEEEDIELRLCAGDHRFGGSKCEINSGRFRGAEHSHSAVRRVRFVPDLSSFLHVGGANWGTRSGHLGD